MQAPGSRRLSLLLLCCAAANGQTALAAERGGADIYRAGCASCHGPDGKGAERARLAFADFVPDLSDCNFTREPDADWIAVVHDGGPARAFSPMMPAFGDELDDREIAAVVAYLRTLCDEPSWPRGELNFPRALVTEKAFVEDELVLTSGVALQDQTRVRNRLVFEKRVLSRGQVEVLIPFSVLESEDGNTRAGLGDVAFASKWVLADSLRWGSILSAAGEVVLPTGKENNGFGAGVIVFEPFLAFGQLLPWSSFLDLQGGVALPAEKPQGVENELFIRGALGTTFEQANFGRAWSPIVEALVSRELTGGAPTLVDVVPQMQVTLNRRQHVMASLGVRVPLNQRAGRNPEILAYLLWDWYDGGLLEGW